MKRQSPAKTNKNVYGYGFDETLDKIVDRAIENSPTPRRQSSRGLKKPIIIHILPLHQLGKTAIIKPKPIDINLKSKLDKSPRIDFNFHDEIVKIE